MECWLCDDLYRIGCRGESVESQSTGRNHQDGKERREEKSANVNDSDSSDDSDSDDAGSTGFFCLSIVDALKRTKRNRYSMTMN